MKYLITGLGNIGEEYANTRHNIGFMALDAFAEASNAVFKSKRYGDICQLKYKGRTIILLKPSTYVNLSGKAINYWLQKEKIPNNKLMVILDDLAIPFGMIRLRKKGGNGGHNGLKSIESTLGTSQYARLRFGIGSEFNQGQQVNYVLGEWSKDELDQLSKRFDIISQIIHQFVSIGIERTMNEFNNNKPTDI